MNRKENDITNVTMFLDSDSHKITEIYLHMQVLPYMNELKCRIEENYSDLLVNVSNELVIIDRDYKLMLKE